MAAEDTFNPHQFAAHVMKSGGGTVNTSSGKSPSGGFMVAKQNTERIVPGHLRGEHVANYAAEHAKALSSPGAHLGAWHEGGSTYLDVSHNIPTKKAAMKMGRRETQHAIYDIDNNAVHDVKDRKGKNKYRS